MNSTGYFEFTFNTNNLTTITNYLSSNNKGNCRGITYHNSFVYIATLDSIIKVTTDGEYVSSWVCNTNIHDPFGICNDGTYLYVTNSDLDYQNITKYNISNGSYVATFSPLTGIRNIACDGSSLFVVYSDNRIIKLSNTGDVLAENQSVSSEYYDIRGITYYNNKLYYVATNHVQSYELGQLLSSDLTKQETFSGLSNADTPNGMTNDGTYLYVTWTDIDTGVSSIDTHLISNFTNP